jgi:nucleoside-diphosphate-sugar epimerase
MQSVFSWLDEDYDKVGVERAVMADRNLPATILRLPMVYGPGDPLHRFHPILKRVDDRRIAILMDEKIANWRGPRGYVEDVAHAVALATVSPKSAGRIYNIVDPEAFTEREWTEKIAHAGGWNGKIHVLPSEKTPTHLKIPFRSEQQWIVSSARIREELGYRELVPPDMALKRTIEWERANPPANIPPSQFDYAAEDTAFSAIADG